MDGSSSDKITPMTVFPTEINHIKARGLVRITWDDGHVGEYEQEYLRGYCPCALCQGHGAQRRFVDTPGATLEEIRGVGNYAIDLRWNDRSEEHTSELTS